MKKYIKFVILPLMFSGFVHAREMVSRVDESTVAAQNSALEKNTEGKGYGPQSPRDLANKRGENKRIFSVAPDYRNMNLCNIHFHKNAEHKGGEFTAVAGGGNGHGSNGHGSQAGYQYNGKISAKESRPLDAEVCKSEHGGLQAGDTIELHYVHSSARVVPGATLGACLSETDSNPQLRVEAQVFGLVNDSKAADFSELTKFREINGYYQAVNIPRNMGRPIRYAGSTTGPAYNEKGSPLNVSWSVRPRVMKVNAESVGQWCKGNVFKEDHAHGARNLVSSEKLLSRMK